MRSKDTGPTSSVQKPVFNDVRRTQYDLSHWSMKTGAIGSLQTLSCIKVVAGDSMSLDASLVFRLSPLRRNLYLDAVVDLFAFYVPDRHVYGQNWVDFMKAGFDEAVTLGTDTLAVQTANNYNCFGAPLSQGTAYPRWATRPYVQIWNRYFRDPTDVAGLLSESYFTGTPTAAEANYGLKTCHIKRIWNCANLTTLTSADYTLPAQAAGEVDLYALAALKGRLRTESARDWFATRYNDLLKHTFDSTVNIDADQRPELVMRSRQWLSGYDVDGTDDATLGNFSGKAAGVMHLNFPTRFFPEHGSLWIMGLVRFPAIVINEYNYLYSKAEPTYAQIAGDPDIIRRSKPVSLNGNELSLANVVVGDTPHSQWFREQPSTVHEDYYVTAGHPFLNLNSATVRNDFVYIPQTQYDEVFKTLQLKHWNCQGHLKLTANRFIPDVRESIFAGTE